MKFGEIGVFIYLFCLNQATINYVYIELYHPIYHTLHSSTLARFSSFFSVISLIRNTQLALPSPFPSYPHSRSTISRRQLIYLIFITLW